MTFQMIVFIWLFAFALAEPPVGDGYAPARLSHTHDSEGLSQEYGLPEIDARSQKDYAPVAGRSQASYIPSTRTGLSQEYGPPSKPISNEYSIPSFTSDISKEYGLLTSRSRVSQEYGVPSVSLSQRYGVPNARGHSSEYDGTSGLSQGYDVPRSRGLSQQYGAPNARTLSQQYGTPSSRALFQQYGVPSSRALSQEYGAPGTRSLSQEYGVPSTRGLTQEYGVPSTRGLTQEYGVPSTRGLSQEYGVPSTRGLSQQYGAPNSRNTIDTEYGTPSGRSQNYPSAYLSQEHNALQIRSGPQDYDTINHVPSDSYGAPLQKSTSATYVQPGFRSATSEEYGIPAQRNFGQTSTQSNHGFNPASRSSIISSRQNKPLTSSRTFQNSFGLKSSSQSLNAFSDASKYGAPSAISDSYSPSSKSVSQSYLPSSRTVSQTYGVPSERTLSSEYGTPEARTNLKPNTYTSTFDTARSAPSSKYLPGRGSMPSDQYGVPEQYDSLSTQGYNYARNALDELLNQEPANYEFGYKVDDYKSGSDFGHTESRQDNKAEGSYFVVLPDGTKQTVEYEADERGFKPRISVEPAEARSGYDSDVTRSEEGPY